jgi:hypothetical protein
MEEMEDVEEFRAEGLATCGGSESCADAASAPALPDSERADQRSIPIGSAAGIVSSATASPCLTHL